MTPRSNYYFLALILMGGCARQTTPNGGPQDKTPPKLVLSVPSNNQKNFKEKEITLTFDEDVKLKEPKEQIIITPSPGKDITFLAKNERILITVKNPWRDSTTYSISFREGIEDITESNDAENLHLAFSTGPTIDSLLLKGTVADALIEKIPENITVAIYQSDTFNIFKHIPAYFTKTDKQGRFYISNLKPGKYKVYAFADKNKNLKFEPKTEMFGFIPGKVDLSSTTDSIRIFMIQMDARPLALNSTRHAAKSSTLKFNKAVVGYTAAYPGNKMLTSFGDDQTEVKFYYPDVLSDSLAVNLHATDSLQQSIDTLIYLKSGKAPAISQSFNTELKELAFNSETSVMTTQITFTKPLASISLDSLLIRVDSLTTIPITTHDIKYDTVHHKLDLIKSYDKTLANNTKPLQLFIGKHSFVSVDHDSSKMMSKIFAIPKAEETATLLIEVKTEEPQYVVQLLTTQNKVVRTSRNMKKIAFKNITPSDYKVRVLLDTNNNNEWDPGDITKDIPPERTLFYKNADGRYNFPVRANWEVGPYILSF